MSHLFRFFARPVAAGRWVIEGEELHHLRKVLRLSPGTLVEVQDGCGRWAEGSIVAIDNHEASVAPTAEHTLPPPTLKLLVCAGALKPGAIDDVLPALIELGADEIHVFLQEETAKSRLTDKQLERWERIALAACKQSKRAWLPSVIGHSSLDALLASLGSRPLERLVLEPGAKEALINCPLVAKYDWCAVVGGEKGLSPNELGALTAAGFRSVALGPFILRALTALSAATAVLGLRRETLALGPSA